VICGTGSTSYIASEQLEKRLSMFISTENKAYFDVISIHNYSITFFGQLKLFSKRPEAKGVCNDGELCVILGKGTLGSLLLNVF